MKLIGLLTLFISLISCSQTTQNNVKSEVPSNWKTINGTDYMIQYPDSFDLDLSGQMGASFFLFSQLTSKQDLFRENINLIKQNLSGQNISLDNFAELSENQIRTMVTNPDIIESKRVKSGNSEFQKMIYSGVQGQYKITFEQYYLISKSYAYVLTFTSESNQYDQYKAVGEQIMNSFKLK